MIKHDPRQVIEELRDHLATHDKPLVFLFGAGTSAAINVAPPPKKGEKPLHKPLIPGIEGLTDHCARVVFERGKEYENAWKALLV